MSDHQLAAQVIAAAFVGLLILLLTRIRRSIPIATDRVTYTPAAGMTRTLLKGAHVPPNEVADAERAKPGSVEHIWKTGLSSIIVGKDNRTSTSKTVVFLWTLAIAYGLAALLAADLLGDSAGWDHQIENGLQEEYLLLLGGPYAAAILSKFSAVTQSQTEGKPPAPMATSSATQLVSDDAGDTDLGDLQYVVFNVVALVYFLGKFTDAFDSGFPHLPALLTGLVLTSAGGYAAKKLLRQSGPTLTSAVPASAVRGTAGVYIYGTNLVIPPGLSPTGAVIPPTVTIGTQAVTPTAHEQILGADRLTVTIPPGAIPGAGTISVVRADGIPAVGPAGSDGLPFTVT